MSEASLLPMARIIIEGDCCPPKYPLPVVTLIFRKDPPMIPTRSSTVFSMTAEVMAAC